MDDFIPIDWFNRYFNKKLLCRYHKCKKHPKSPYHFYCSENHRKLFLERTYFKFIQWDSIKSRILKRDHYICKICHVQHQYPFDTLQVDHIKPRSVVYREVMAEFDKLSNHLKKSKIIQRKYFIEYLRQANDPKNLRTLCDTCHKVVTADFLGSPIGKIIVAESKKNNAKPKSLGFWSSDYIDDYFPYVRYRNRWNDNQDPPYTPLEQYHYDMREYFKHNSGLFAALVFFDNLHITMNEPVTEQSKLEEFIQLKLD